MRGCYKYVYLMVYPESRILKMPQYNYKFVADIYEKLFTHPGGALLWVPTLGGAPARAPGGYVFEEQVGVGVHNALG